MDPLDDVFAAMRLKSALYSRLLPHAPWGISFVRSASIRFGFMVSGHGMLIVEGVENPIELRQGDGFLVKPETLFSLVDNPSTPTQWCEDIFAECSGNSLSFGGDGEVANILCGYFSFDTTGAEPLLSLLPSVVVIPSDAARSPLLEATLKLLAIESTEQHMGSRIVVSRLADVFFVQAIRAHYLREQTHKSWIAALADPRLSRVVKQIHRDIGRPWSLKLLAAEAGMSRSSFAVHFKDITGITPGDYLTHWRMYRARCLLRHPQLTLAKIAEMVGYDSGITLGRAFKRFTGVTAGEYRKRSGQGPDSQL
ncbi:TPA: AraC family transcriptional regulator [Klebsiella variicola subsp. variicola]|nr:AraC family transcriptional regulator [Klebsiella variicola subsp. variicola]